MKVTGTIEVKVAQKQVRKINGRRGEFEVHEQEAFVQAGDEVRKIRLTLDASQEAYPVGKYQCDTPLMVGQYGDLVVPRQLNLSPGK